MAHPSPSPSVVHLPVLAPPAAPSAAVSAEALVAPPCHWAAPGDGGPPPASSRSITYSHLERFAQCPLSFRLHYVDRLTWAKRVVVAFDLLRHDVVVAITRTDTEREATRRYILATLDQIERRAFPARPSTICAHCDHRSQCPTYADARAGKRREVGVEPDDLPAVAHEREEVAVLLRALGERKDALDAMLRAALDDQDELHLEGRRYALVTAMHRAYPLPETLRALEAAGVSRETSLRQLGAVPGSDLKPLLGDLAKTLPRSAYEALQAVLDRDAGCSPVTRLTVREVRS